MVTRAVEHKILDQPHLCLLVISCASDSYCMSTICEACGEPLIITKWNLDKAQPSFPIQMHCRNRSGRKYHFTPMSRDYAGNHLKWDNALGLVLTLRQACFSSHSGAESRILEVDTALGLTAYTVRENTGALKHVSRSGLILSTVLC